MAYMDSERSREREKKKNEILQCETTKTVPNFGRQFSFPVKDLMTHIWNLIEKTAF